jgi:hypothetical protein
VPDRFGHRDGVVGLALMREEQVTPQRMQTFALVELTPYPAS